MGKSEGLVFFISENTSKGYNVVLVVGVFHIFEIMLLFFLFFALLSLYVILCTMWRLNLTFLNR